MYVHSNCKIKLFNSRSLEEAKKQKEKEQEEKSENGTVLAIVSGDGGNPLHALYHAIRTQNWEEYLIFIRMMLPWMSAYDSLHYSRYLSVYWSTINNLDEKKAVHVRSRLFSASTSGRPYSALPHGQWIEMTMNKGSKMQCGWIGITNNEAAVNNITKTKESLKEVANIKKRQFQHIECSPAQMEKVEKLLKA